MRFQKQIKSVTDRRKVESCRHTTSGFRDELINVKNKIQYRARSAKYVAFPMIEVDNESRILGAKHIANVNRMIAVAFVTFDSFFKCVSSDSETATWFAVNFSILLTSL